MSSSALLAAIASKQWATALAVALPLWRKTRGPRLSAIVETEVQFKEPLVGATPKLRKALTA